MDSSNLPVDHGEMHRGRVVVILAAVALGASGVLGLAGIVAHAFDHGRTWQRADITADWVVTRAALTGADPYADTAQLAHRFGTTVVDRAEIGGASQEAPHPRPPAAFLVLAPLLAVSARHAYALSAIVNLLLLGGLAILIAAAIRRPLWMVVLGVGVAMNATVVKDAFGWGTLSLVMATLLLATYLGCRDRDRAWAGVPLAIAIALKLFPGALVIVLVVRRRYRAAATSLAVFAGLTAGGLALPGVHVRAAIHGLAGASSAWIGSPGNSSLASGWVRLGVAPGLAVALGFAGAAAFAIVLLRRARAFEVAYWGTALAMLLASPISWRHYDLMLVAGLAVVVCTTRSAVARAVIIAWGVFTMLSVVVLSPPIPRDFELHHYGVFGLVGRALIVVGLLAAAFERKPASELDDLSDAFVDEYDIDAFGTVHAHGDRHLEVART